jgi:hypothetical protein
MVRLKREKSEQEAEKLKQAARGAIKDYELSRQRKQDMLYSSGQAKYPPVRQFPDPHGMSGSGTTIADLSFSRAPADRTIEFEQSLMQDPETYYGRSLHE